MLREHKRSDTRKRSWLQNSLENGTSNVSKMVHEEEILLFHLLLLYSLRDLSEFMINDQ